MTKIKLEITNSGKVIAPSFCPYAEKELVEGTKVTNNERLIVRPGLCCICKLCQFVPTDIPIIKEIMQSEKDSIAIYLTQQNKKVASAMLAQFQYLVKEEKSPIAMIIVWNLLQEALKSVIEDIDRMKQLEQYFLLNDVAICYCMGCPVYVSKKLSKTLLQVVGEIYWRV
jgi:hypothetical protein